MLIKINRIELNMRFCIVILLTFLLKDTMLTHALGCLLCLGLCDFYVFFDYKNNCVKGHNIGR